MAKRQGDSDLPRGALAASAVLLATFLLATTGTSAALVLFALLVIAVVAGAVSGTWWATVAVPAAVSTGFGLAAATYGPSAGGGEPLGAAAVAILALAAAAVIAAAAGLGVLAGKTLLRPVGERLRAGGGKLVGAAVLIVIAVIAIAAIRGNRNHDRLGVVVRESDRMTVWSGKPWDGRGASGISEQEAKSTAAFDVYWLGPTFAGLHLQVIEPTSAGAEFTFIYGTCSSTRFACAAPLSVQSGPVCRIGLTPHDGQGRAPEVIDGGAWLRRGSGSAYWIWSGDSALTVYSTALPEAEVFAALSTMSGVAPGRLQPPDFRDCPDRPGQNAVPPSPRS